MDNDVRRARTARRLAEDLSRMAALAAELADEAVFRGTRNELAKDVARELGVSEPAVRKAIRLHNARRAKWVKFRMNAGLNERFTESAARSLIGQRPRINYRETDDGPVLAEFGHALVTNAEVVDGGRAMLITYEPVEMSVDVRTETDTANGADVA